MPEAGRLVRVLKVRDFSRFAQINLDL